MITGQNTGIIKDFADITDNIATAINTEIKLVSEKSAR